MIGILTIIGFILGGLVGFLLRPSAGPIGQLSFADVITRGTSYSGIDQALLGSVAQASFNYMAAGAILGAIGGVILGYSISKSKRQYSKPVISDEDSAIGRVRHYKPGRPEEIDNEVEELRRSINARRNHGILYYVLLVVILLAGFFIGYATHSLVGAAIILIGLALVAWREVTGFKARTAVLNQLLGEKLAQRRQDDEAEGV